MASAISDSAAGRFRTLMPTPSTLTRFMIYDLRLRVYDSRACLTRCLLADSFQFQVHSASIVNRKPQITMKLLVFAHVPPPYHGQSAAVQQMLKHFGGNRRKSKFRREPPNHYGIECYHVNARLSKTLEDVGEFQFRKFDQILFYCLQAIWCRFRYGVKTLYYVPAPGKTVALYRDWLVMFFCRPFFERIIFHWHGSGLAKWL